MIKIKNKNIEGIVLAGTLAMLGCSDVSKNDADIYKSGTETVEVLPKGTETLEVLPTATSIAMFDSMVDKPSFALAFEYNGKTVIGAGMSYFGGVFQGSGRPLNLSLTDALVQKEIQDGDQETVTLTGRFIRPESLDHPNFNYGTFGGNSMVFDIDSIAVEGYVINLNDGLNHATYR